MIANDQRPAAAHRRLGDGGMHAIKAQTGEKVWSFLATKRAINTGVAVSGSTVFVSHGDENTRGRRARSRRRHRRQPDRRHQDDEVGRPRNRVRVLLSDRGRHAALSDRQRFDAALPTTRRLARRCGLCRWALRRRPRPSWPTARSTSAPMAARSSSSGQAPTRARS